MGLKDLFRPRRPVDTDAIDAIHDAELARQNALVETQRARLVNDRIEQRVQQNHFGEALARAWARRAA